MLLQQKEISKMRRSTQYFREKIHKYRQHSRTSMSPDRSRTPVGAGHSVDDHLSYSVGPSDIERDSFVAPSEQLDESFPSYTSVGRGNTSGSSLNRSPDKPMRPNWSTPQFKKSPMSASPLALGDMVSGKREWRGEGSAR